MRWFLAQSFGVAALLPGLVATQVFGPPTRFLGVGPTASWPTLAEQGLALYFVDQTDGNVYVARRSTLPSPWGQPELVYDSQPFALGPRVSPDGKELFAYAFVGSVRQVFRSARQSLFERFPPLQQILELSSTENRGPGCLSSDALTLYYWHAATKAHWAARSAVGQPFIDHGEIGPMPIGWISDDQRVALTSGVSTLRRNTTAEYFATIRSAGPVTQPLSGAPTFLPATGELFYWRDDGTGTHELMLATRKDTLVDYSNATPGGQFDFDIYGRPVELWVLLLGTGTQSVVLPPFGVLQVGGTIFQAGIGVLPSNQLVWSPILDPFPATFSLTIPQTSALVNLTLNWQALRVDRVVPSRGGFTNLVSTTIQAP